MKIIRIVISLIFSLFLFISCAHAYTAYPQQAASQIQPSAITVLKQGIEQLTGYLGSRNNPGAQPLQVFVEQKIAPLFDFNYMAKWVAGPRAYYMNPQQQAAMEQKLRQLFLAAMVKKLQDYRHGRVRFLRPEQNPRTGEVTLRLLAYQQNNPYPQRLSFRMYPGRQGWKVFDVSANGQSALAYYRTQFALEARQQARPAYR